MDAVVASLSLHHVADLGAVLDRVRGLLVVGSVLVVLEWARERFDEATARWCFDRLPEQGTDGGTADGTAHCTEHGAAEGGALRRRRADWESSGLPWDCFCHDWAHDHGIPPAATIRRELDKRFTMTHASWGPYYFPELAGTDEADEQAAIDAGRIRACCLRYAGRRVA